MRLGYFRYLSCLGKKPLLDDQHGNLEEDHSAQYNLHQINYLTSLVEQSKVIIQEKEDELEDLRYKIANITPVTVVENITKCKQVSNCQHDTCDFGPIVKTIKQVRTESQDYYYQYSAVVDEYIQKLKHALNDRNKEIEERDQVILNLNNQIQANFDNMNNLNNHIDWYKENYQRLLDENEYIKNDNQTLLRSKTFHKNQSTKLRTQLASVPENIRVSANTESKFQPLSGMYSQ